MNKHINDQIEDADNLKNKCQIYDVLEQKNTEITGDIQSLTALLQELSSQLYINNNMSIQSDERHEKRINKLEKNQDSIRLDIKNLRNHLDNGYRTELVNMLIEQVTKNNEAFQEIVIKKDTNQTKKKTQWYKYVLGQIAVGIITNVESIINLFQG